MFQRLVTVQHEVFRPKEYIHWTVARVWISIFSYDAWRFGYNTHPTPPLSQPPSPIPPFPRHVFSPSPLLTHPPGHICLSFGSSSLLGSQLATALFFQHLHLPTKSLFPPHFRTFRRSSPPPAPPFSIPWYTFDGIHNSVSGKITSWTDCSSHVKFLVEGSRIQADGLLHSHNLAQPLPARVSV